MRAHKITRRILAFLALFLFSASVVPAAERGIILSGSLTLQRKLDLLQEAASTQGLAVQILRATDVDDATLETALRDAAWMLVDAPRATDLDGWHKRLEDVGVALPARQIWVSRSTMEVHGFSHENGQRLASYFRHGGRANLANFATFLRALLAGQSTDAIPAPVELPTAGAYHPRYPGRVSASLDEVLSTVSQPDSPGVIGIGFHVSYLESEALEHIDALVAAIEAKGVTALPVFYPIGPDADLPAFLGNRIDILLHLQPVYHTGLAEQFEQLDIPVLQGIGWSADHADPQVYREDPIGISLASTPLYLALPEQNGLIDPVVAWVRGQDTVAPIPEHIEALAANAIARLRLQKTPRPDRRLALMVYNYPPGEKNMSASFMNIPRSLETVSSRLADSGYSIDHLPESAWTEQIGRLIAAWHHPEQLPELLADGLAARYPLDRYIAWYRTLPASVRTRIETRWGAPETSPMIHDGAFIIPRLLDGHLAVLPQPPRGRPGADKDENRLYHDVRVPVNHAYLATYLWIRHAFDAHALIHFGTHGTQEWMPGKERGLHIHDDALLPLGDIPVIYPYIIDNVGEATQAKRRGRAVIVSHQTPLFRPSGLHGRLVELHNLLHQYLSLETGEVRSRTARRIRDLVLEDKNLRDLGWTRESIDADFDAFQLELHDYLHELAAQSQPIGLHTFGATGDDKARIATVMQAIGPELIPALNIDDPAETFVDDYEALETTSPFQWTAAAVGLGDGPPSPRLPELEARAREIFQALDASGEIDGLLRALDARHLPSSIGGDPLRAPESLPTGRNMHGFDPSTIPTREAWATGAEAVEKLIAEHTARHGQPPRKLAFSLWAVEAMRHGGVLESQALRALGVRPVWNRQGRVTGIEVIPREELGRDRVDVVLSATGLYRDQFPNLMAHLARAAAEVARLDEPGNPVQTNTRNLIRELTAAGIPEEKAASLAQIRLFGSPTGVYSTGLEDAVRASDTWESDDKLARLYLDRMSHAFGPDPATWSDDTDTATLYAANLRDVEAAVLARTSNLYGMLTTDDPFQYLGGISLAVRHLSGRSPELYISNQRQRGTARIQSAARFLATELQTRAFHPGWIKSMQAEGYAGTLTIQDTVDNLWGWQVVSPSMVTGNQWQRLHEVYVKDDLGLGVPEWFEQHHPEALVRITERMLDAIRKGYWDASETTRRELVEAWSDLTRRHGIKAGHEKLAAFIEGLAAGFGLATAPDAPEAQPAAPKPPAPQPQSPPTSDAAAQTVTGRQLREVAAEPPSSGPASYWLPLALLLPLLAGAIRQSLRRTS
ncbi:MAG: cobaltochelatase subunit CobN [Bacteroidetes bacterium]|nr:MAG: cobaltochelatase subunit CobN [Bacteroidota bacterium]